MGSDAKIKIAVFTAIRSEYGLLTPLLKRLNSDPVFDLQLLVGGAHLSKQFGFTRDKILSDGFQIKAEFDFLQDSTLQDYVTRSMSILQNQIGTWLVENKPDLLLVLGDRFELIPVVVSALLYGVPICHISGGDITKGSVDNQIRHAITKMAHLHFPATEQYKRNLINLGEEEWRICVSGEPGLDALTDLELCSKRELFEQLGLKLSKPVVCATFHPETIDNSINSNFLEHLFSSILRKTDFQIVATASNYDIGGAEINSVLEKLSKEHDRIIFVKSFGQQKYYSLLKHATLMLGNSSSGLIEAQSFNLPVVNVGERQSGRIANKSVVHAKTDVPEILQAIDYAKSPEFAKVFMGQPNVYGDGKASDRIVSFIKSIDTKNKKLLVKSA